MVIAKLLVLFTVLMNIAHASDVTDAFKAKDFERVSDIYRDQPKRNYDPKELVYISYSLRKMGFYRQDIKLNILLIKKKFLADHQRLIKQIKEAETVDSEQYPEGLKVLYWNLMNDYGIILESYKDKSTLIKKDHQHYLVYSKILAELEFREGRVDRFNDRIVAHIQLLENRVYKSSSSYYFQYVSWQTEAQLLSATSKTDLIVTNRGFCLGGDAGIENKFYHFYVDGCLLLGAGGVSADSTAPQKYEQSGVPAFGAKVSPGASMIVSSSGSRIGVRLPLIYSLQSLQDAKSPSTGTTYPVKQINPFNVLASLYSRWQFPSWYFQTEFGKYLQVEHTFWGIGVGKNF